MAYSTWIGTGMVATVMMALPQGGLVLRRQLTENAADTYKVEFASKQRVLSDAGGGEQTFGVSGTMLYAQKVGKYNAEKKANDMEVTVSKVKVQLEGLAIMIQSTIDQLPKEIVLKGMLDERNRWTPGKPDPKYARFAAIMRMIADNPGQYLIYPDQALKIGDAWEPTVGKLPAFGNKEFKLKARYTGDKAVGNLTAAAIVVEGTLPLDVDMSQLGGESEEAAGAMDGARLTGPMDLHLEALVDKATGRVLELKATTSGRPKLNLPSAGQTMDVEGTSTTKMALAGPEKAQG